MNFDEFTGEVQHRLELPGTGEVQHRLELPGTGEAVRAIRATLSTLGQRIPEGNAEDLAASLPMEIKWYLTGAVEEHGQRFDWSEFVDRVSETTGEAKPDAAYHSRVVMDLVHDVVPESDFYQLRDQLPESEDEEVLMDVAENVGLHTGKLRATIDAINVDESENATPRIEVDVGDLPSTWPASVEFGRMQARLLGEGVLPEHMERSIDQFVADYEPVATKEVEQALKKRESDLQGRAAIQVADVGNGHFLEIS